MDYNATLAWHSNWSNSLCEGSHSRISLECAWASNVLTVGERLALRTTDHSVGTGTNDLMGLVDNCENIGHAESLDWIFLEHSDDNVDELLTVAKFSHEVDLLVDLGSIQFESLEVIEVGDWVVTSSA